MVVDISVMPATSHSSVGRPRRGNGVWEVNLTPIVAFGSAIMLGDRDLGIELTS